MSPDVKLLIHLANTIVVPITFAPLFGVKTPTWLVAAFAYSAGYVVCGMIHAALARAEGRSK
jgi:FtsH-binding integral membrane protein